ncbi:MAG: hypothetical protein EAZ30_17665 [Betaproteobacteria bacterium]|nr:MAG: hypothetical protein EAZ30_17665 [Betaproteobacteria bacterium]
MPRTPTPLPAVAEHTLDEAKLAELQAARTAMAVVDFEGQENLIALAQQFGYKDALSVGALEDGIRFYQQRTAEACMELGKRLVLLKEATQHGEFKSRLDLLGIEDRMARRFMAAAVKFSKRATLPVLNAANSQSKLLELLVLDDSELAELSDGGTVRGLTVDDVDRMGVRELRANLREARADKVADDKLLAKKSAEIDKLSRRIAKAAPDEVLLELQKEATTLMNDALGCIRGQLRQAFIALTNHEGGSADHSSFMAGLLGQVQADVTALRTEFDLADVSNARDQELLAEQAQWAKD